MITSTYNTRVVPDSTIDTTSTTSTEATKTASAISMTATTASLTTTDVATTSEDIQKCVRNLSSTPLTEAQVSLLVHGPNFAVAPRHPPMGSTSLQ